MSYLMEEKQRAYSELKRMKQLFAERNWFPATSGNLSIRLGEPSMTRPLVFAITSSGRDKSIHTPEDFLLVNGLAEPVEATHLRPSAETLIHAEIYRLTDAGAIFHVHTVFNNLAAAMFAEEEAVQVKGVELIKAFNIWEEDAEIEVPILPNYADISRIAKLIESRLNHRVPGILLDRHGIYAWGKNSFEAKRHLEAFEFLFEYVVRWQQSGKLTSSE